MGNRTVSSSREFIVNGGADISPEPSFAGETLARLLKKTLEQAESDKMKRAEIKNLGDKISGLLRDNSNCFYKVDGQNNILSELQDDLSGPGCLALGDIYINSEDGLYYFWLPDDSAIVIDTRTISQSYVTDGAEVKYCINYDISELKSMLSEANKLIDSYDSPKTDGKVHRHH